MPIQNDQEYSITQKWVADFEQAVSYLKQAPEDGVHPTLHEAQIAALEGQLADLRAQIAEYDARRKQ